MELLILRAVERIIGVLTGGLCIYLGYRLFMALPTRTTSTGKVVLPGGISVYLSRVGPGVFFALFGTIVLGAAFFFGLRINPSATGASGAAQGSSVNFVEEDSRSASSEAGSADELASERKLVEDEILTANRLMTKLEGAGTAAIQFSPEERASIVSSATRLKSRALRTVWIEDDWGSFDAFERWVINQGHDPRARVPDPKMGEAWRIWNRR